MSWGLGWKRPLLDDDDHQTHSESSKELINISNNNSNNNNNNQELGSRIDLDWNAGDDEEQVTLRLQSQVMVALPLPQDTVVIRFLDSGRVDDDNDDEGNDNLVDVDMKVVKQREPLKAVALLLTTTAP